MDILQKQVTELTGAINNVLNRLKAIEGRLQSVESSDRPGVTLVEQPTPLCSPRTEADLKEIGRLPDCVKELQVFDGNPTQYVSWVHTVEGILKDFSIIKDKPLYRAILQHVRQKIRGNADNALISYNIFDDDWAEIKKCLSLHYADKRDIRTLEHQLNQLSQRGMRLDEFFANVNHQFSLIINKIKTESYSQETVNALVETYRNRALDVFIRGLNGDLSRMLIVQKPKTLPEAYTACLEIQNLNFRNHSIHSPSTTNTVTAPLNQTFKPAIPPKRHFRYPYESGNHTYYPSNSGSTPPLRPTAPKPHEKMDVDRSMQSRNVNYMNRPRGSNPFSFKRKTKSENYPQKQQRLYHMEMREEEPIVDYDELAQEEVQDEVNFMKDAHPAFHI